MTVSSTVGVAPQLSTRRERIGWYFYDWANSAFPTTVVTVFLGPYLNNVAEKAADAHGRVHPLGVPVASGSLFSYTVSVSTLLTVLVLPVVGAVADRSAHKRRLLALFAYVGAAAAIAMGFVTGTRYLLGAVLLVVAEEPPGGLAVELQPASPTAIGTVSAAARAASRDEFCVRRARICSSIPR